MIRNQVNDFKGFTLMELMVVVGIIGILSAVAVPMISATIPRYRLRATARELLIDFKKAKLEAVKRNRTVLLEFTQETVGNATAGGSYQVCVDDPTVGIAGTCDPAEIIRSITMQTGIRLTTNQVRLGYTRRGMPWTNQFGTVTVRTADGARSYGITLGPAGRALLQ